MSVMVVEPKLSDLSHFFKRYLLAIRSDFLSAIQLAIVTMLSHAPILSTILILETK
jgi:hypothetical protein